jgi:four helix bundle protein
MESNQKLRTHAISAARDFQELPAWQKAVDLAEKIYGLREDRAGLVAHMRNSALTVAASIAAASGRNNEFGMTDSYSKAQSANAELMTQLTLAQRTGHLGEEETTELLAAIDEVSRLIVGLKHGMKVAAKDKENAEKDAARADREYKKDRKEREDRPRREYKPRDRDGDREERQYKPRGEFKSRDGEDRPRREYKPRDGEDRPRREYKPRGEGEERPRREFKDRGDRKPYGDKKSFGDKKPYGKKPFGGKPRGDKPFRKPRD